LPHSICFGRARVATSLHDRSHLRDTDFTTTESMWRANVYSSKA